jgi:hypothetical protein
MKKLILFFVVFVILFPKYSYASVNHLVISQVQIAGAKTTDDFVEIYNPTSEDIDLKGTRLGKRTQTGDADGSLKSWTETTIIKSHGFYLWANSDFANLAVSPDSATGSFISNDNGVALRSGLANSGTIIDSVAWGNAANTFVEGAAYATNPDPGKSLMRKLSDSGEIIDTDNNSSDFSIQTSSPHNLASVAPPDTNTTTPQPVQEITNTTPTPPPSGGSSATAYSNAVVISELLPNPDGTDSGEEWIELGNPTDAAIDVAGWILDDESKTGTVGTSAYTLPAGTVISAKNYLALDLPEGSFALDNTGGDTLRLLWPNKQLATEVIYTGNAAEDTTYARKADGTYAWTKLATKGSANQFGTEPQIIPPTDNLQTGSFASDKIQINEIFPNPAGTDSGYEWVEVLNSGTTPVTLHGWILDDGGKTDPIGSSAYHIESPTVQPGAVAVINIPAGKFAMNNSGAETIRLFSPDKVLADSVTYSGAKEGLSYSKLADIWSWGTPSPNATNSVADAEPDIVINEVFPNPSKFEIPKQTLEPGKFVVFKRSQSNIALANSAKEKLELISQSGIVVSALEYEDAPKNLSFARTDAGDYDWTGLVTAGDANKFSKSGKVAGASLVRTGNPDGQDNSIVLYFAVFTIIWYIARAIVNPKGETENEQTRTH